MGKRVNDSRQIRVSQPCRYGWRNWVGGLYIGIASQHIEGKGQMHRTRGTVTCGGDARTNTGDYAVRGFWPQTMFDDWAGHTDLVQFLKTATAVHRKGGVTAD